MNKVSCGGFYLGDGLEMETNENGQPVLKSTGGSGLPSVTAADNGKLLGVVEGEWGKVNGGSGSDVFAVTFMLNGDNIVCDKSYDEIKQAVESGKFIYGIFLENGYRTPLIFDLIEPTEEHGSAVFHQMNVYDGTLEGINIVYFTDGHTEFEEFLYQLTPAND